MKYDVAVITPVFDTQDYLHKCLRSILDQKGLSLQLIIIDDGSSDNSADIIRYYQAKDRRVTFVSKRNEGQGIARNIGLSIADAKFVYFIDSDDSIGPNSLVSLYEAAMESDLDLCSPDIPSKYFDKPLEYVACLPCKAQFMRLDIIKKYGLLQPDVRSGQDGVFSHLFLTHATRIGMLKTAKYNYTHAREGSTFATFMKRPNRIPGIVEDHFSAIVNHYNQWDLWPSNALRLLEFIEQETVRNRLGPHFAHLNDVQRRRCAFVLMKVAKKASLFLESSHYDYLTPVQLALINEADPDKFISAFPELSLKNFDRAFERNMILKRNLIILKSEANNRKFEPKQSVGLNMSLDFKQSAAIGDKSELASLGRKLDLSINMLVNHISQTKLSHILPLPQLDTEGVPSLVVSMTSLPHRLHYLKYTVESMFRQTLLPIKIVIWLSDEISDRKEIERDLRVFIDRGLAIEFVKDVGPHTKLIYALQRFPQSVVVSVDDDMIYPVNMLQALWAQHKLHQTSVIANWAREIAFDKAGKVLGIRSGKLLTPPTLENNLETDKRFEVKPNFLAYPYGTCGVLYPPKALSEQVFEYDLYSSLCPKEDDLWFKVMGMLNGTEVVVTDLGINPRHHSIVGAQSVALRHENHGDAKNAEQIRKVFSHFDIYSKIPRRSN